MANFTPFENASADDILRNYIALQQLRSAQATTASSLRSAEEEEKRKQAESEAKIIPPEITKILTKEVVSQKLPSSLIEKIIEAKQKKYEQTLENQRKINEFKDKLEEMKERRRQQEQLGLLTRASTEAGKQRDIQETLRKMEIPEYGIISRIEDILTPGAPLKEKYEAAKKQREELTSALERSKKREEELQRMAFEPSPLEDAAKQGVKQILSKEAQDAIRIVQSSSLPIEEKERRIQLIKERDRQ